MSDFSIFILQHVLQIDSLVYQWICYECHKSRYSVRSLSTVHNVLVCVFCSTFPTQVKVCISESALCLFLPSVNTETLFICWPNKWPSSNKCIVCVCMCVCAFVRMVIWHKDKAWCVKWGVAAMHVCCSLASRRFKQRQPSVERKSNQTTWSSLRYNNSVNHILYHKNRLCYTEHSVLPKWRVNVRVKESGSVPKQYRIVVAVTSVCPPLPHLCKDSFHQPSESV